jgi:hypothetical protein
VALFDGAHNMFGPLGPEIRERLLAFLNAPSFPRWDDIHSIILNAKVGLGITVWQAVIAVDPTFPRTGKPEGMETPAPHERWDRYPDALTVARAIRWAVAQEPRKEKSR